MAISLNKRKSSKSRGATMVEYSILVLLIVFLSIVSLNAIGLWVTGTFERIICEIVNNCP